LTLQGMQFAWSVKPGADHVTLQQIVADGAIYITGAANVAVLGGQVYSATPVTSDSQIASYSGLVPTSILFDGVSFHDWVDAGPTAGANHIECLQIGAGINVTIRNSSFQRCATHDIFVRSWGTLNGNPSPLRNFTIQNNYLGATIGGYYSLRLALQTGWPCTNFLIASNTALQNMFSDCTAVGVQFLGNTQPSMSPYSCTHLFGAIWSGNIFATGVTCGSNRVLASSGAPPPPPGGTGSKPPGGERGKGETTASPTVAPPATDPSAGSERVQTHGRIVALSASALSVQAESGTTVCSRGTGSPVLKGFAVGDTVTVACSRSNHDLITIAHA
jgi:hypothetical protein